MQRYGKEERGRPEREGKRKERVGSKAEPSDETGEKE